KLDTIRAEAEVAKSRSDAAESELAAVKAEITAKDEAAHVLNERITMLESQLETAESGGSDSKSMVRELELKKEDLERKVKSLEKENENLEQKVNDKTAELERINTELQNTLQAMDELDMEMEQQHQIRFPLGCDSLLERCVHIMHTIDPIEKADLTLLLGQQWKEAIQARHVSDNNKNDGNNSNNVLNCENEAFASKVMDIGRASPPDKPLRPDNLEFVRPGFGVKVGKAGSLSSRIAILHALANVEQWAIDTALDNMARFGYYTKSTAGTIFKGDIGSDQEEYTMPNRFFDDFMQMACDESKHFKWLNERLESQGAHYGDLPVHASIWDSCTDTARSALARMAVVHMTIESRGLDVNPATIARFERSGDEDSAKMLQKIHDDEVTHVQIGHRWFCYLLKRHEGVTNGSEQDNGTDTSAAFGAGIDNDNSNNNSYDADPDLYEFRQVTPAYAQKEDGTQEEIVDPVEAQRRKRFQEVVVQYFKGSLKPPFNTVDREKGGLTRGWYEPLVVVRERTGFKPGAGRRLQSKKEKQAEVVVAGENVTKENEGNTADNIVASTSEATSNRAQNKIVTQDSQYSGKSRRTSDICSSILEIPPPDANEEVMRVNGEVLQAAQDWADLLDGTSKCGFERESDYTSSYGRYFPHGVQDNERLSIRRWFWRTGGWGGAGRFSQSREGEYDEGLIPVIGFFICFLLSYYKVYRPLSRLNIQESQRIDLNRSMFKCFIADLIIGVLYPATPFIRLYFCSNRRMTFQARYRVVDHADSCTQAINLANAEMSSISPLRASPLNGIVASLSPIISSAVDSQQQQQQQQQQQREQVPKCIDESNSCAMYTTKRRHIQRPRSAFSAPARLQGDQFYGDNLRPVKPSGNCLQFSSGIEGHSTKKTAFCVDQTVLFTNNQQPKDYRTVDASSQSGIDATVGLGSASRAIAPQFKETLRRRDSVFKALNKESEVFTSLCKAPTVITALLDGNSRPGIDVRTNYGTGSAMTSILGMTGDKDSVKVNQPTIAKHPQPILSPSKPLSICFNDSGHKQRKLRPQQRHTKKPMASDCHLQDLERAIVRAQGANGVTSVVGPKKDSAQSYTVSHGCKRDSHQDCRNTCRGHKVETKKLPKCILQRPTVSFKGAAVSDKIDEPPVEVSFVVALPTALVLGNDKGDADKGSCQYTVDEDSIANRKLVKEKVSKEPLKPQSEVVTVIDSGDQVKGCEKNVATGVNSSVRPIKSQRMRLPVQIKLPPPPRRPLPPLPEIIPVVLESSTEKLTTEVVQQQVPVDLRMEDVTVVENRELLFHYYYHVDTQELVVLTEHDPSYLDI
ncbi:hypothetical protein BGZ46_001741, partial [Entomortierella lignicola]